MRGCDLSQSAPKGVGGGVPRGQPARRPATSRTAFGDHGMHGKRATGRDCFSPQVEHRKKATRYAPSRKQIIRAPQIASFESKDTTFEYSKDQCDTLNQRTHPSNWPVEGEDSKDGSFESTYPHWSFERSFHSKAYGFAVQGGTRGGGSNPPWLGRAGARSYSAGRPPCNFAALENLPHASLFNFVSGATPSDCGGPVSSLQSGGAGRPPRTTRTDRRSAIGAGLGSTVFAERPGRAPCIALRAFRLALPGAAWRRAPRIACPGSNPFASTRLLDPLGSEDPHRLGPIHPIALAERGHRAGGRAIASLGRAEAGLAAYRPLWPGRAQ